ncbi:hypothetical protein [Pseudobdellovibrio exovorus]|uniref:Uncharacterized protein n=1 Tax=Pseudobdellovibrio exovorus JSS TaxID=1184267 RepID=M4V8J2_9BACT|nr:hypothetical protein [Pseudobdellovibrio exovorus]AGH94331.1 hypothetical protein A11Q_111 [Pseudobdellovibrio exovorus JSS]
MKTVLLCALLVCSVSYSHAQSSNPNNHQLISEITQLARTIRDEASTANASTETLRSVRNDLEDALVKLRQSGGDGGNKGECFNYAYEKYFTSNSSGVATDKAIKLCRSVTDVPVLKLAFDKYYVALSSTAAMDKAGTVASLPMRNKVELLSFAFDKYYISLSSTAAMDKAKAVSQLSSGSQSCLRTLFDRYYATYSSTTAMDKAIEGCK